MFEILSRKSPILKEHWTTPRTRNSNKTMGKLATDIFTFNNENYLLIVDYMSRFPVIRCLSNMTAKMVAEHMKAIFSELGVPKTLVSDVVLLPCGCLSLNPFIEISIRNNSSSSNVLNIQASISISPSLNPNKRQQVTVIYCCMTAQMLQYSIY